MLANFTQSSPAVPPPAASEAPPGEAIAGRPVHLVVVTGLYSALTAVLTWPQVVALGRLGIPHPDMFLHTWAMAWVSRQLFADPFRLYESNMYWPMANSLAATESLIPQALMVSPLLHLGAGPLLAHNVAVFVTFPLAGLGAYLLALDLTGSRSGAFLAGLSYAFCAFRWEHFIHVGVLSVQWLPFALLFLRRAVRDPRRSNLAGLVLFCVLQVLSSGYYAVLLAIALAVSLLYYARDLLDLRRALPVAGALGIAVLLVLPAGAPYRELKERTGIRRSDREIVHWSAHWKSYLDPGRRASWSHTRALRAWTGEFEPLYPGTLTSILAVASLAAFRRQKAVRYAVLLSVTGLAASLGPEISLGSFRVPGPYALMRDLPVVQMIRSPCRFGILAVLGVSVLAACGWSQLSRAGHRRFAYLSVGAALLIVAEAYPSGLGARMTEIERPPPVARWLAAAPRGPVLELPWEDSGEYLYWSTEHWQPMINGQSTFAPDTGNFGLALIGIRFTRPYSSRVLRAAGVKWVVVHLNRLHAGARRRILATTRLPKGVELVADFGQDRVYRIGPGPLAKWDPRRAHSGP